MVSSMPRNREYWPSFDIGLEMTSMMISNRLELEGEKRLDFLLAKDYQFMIYIIILWRMLKR